MTSLEAVPKTVALWSFESAAAVSRRAFVLNWSRLHSRSDPLSMGQTLRLLVSFLLFVVFTAAKETRSGKERVYYIGIIEDVWDYAPGGKNLLNGKDIADDRWVWIWCFYKMRSFIIPLLSIDATNPLILTQTAVKQFRVEFLGHLVSDSVWTSE